MQSLFIFLIFAILFGKIIFIQFNSRKKKVEKVYFFQELDIEKFTFVLWKWKITTKFCILTQLNFRLRDSPFTLKHWIIHSQSYSRYCCWQYKLADKIKRNSFRFVYIRIEIKINFRFPVFWNLQQFYFIFDNCDWIINFILFAKEIRWAFVEVKFIYSIL